MQGLYITNWLPLALKIALTVFIVLAMGLLCGLLIARVQRRFNPIIHKEHTFRLTNQGNVTSVYRLIVESLEPLLSFQFLINDVPLPEVAVEIAPPASAVKPPMTAQVNEQAAEVVEPAAETVVQKNKSLPAQMGKPSPSISKSSGKAAQKAVAKTGALASLLGVVGGLLPGSLGASIKEQGTAVRDVQTKTKSAMDKPKEMQRKMDEVQKSSGKLGAKAPQPQTQTAAQTTKSTAVEPVPTTKVNPASSIAATPSNAEVVPSIKYFQTEEINPGDTLSLTLRISSKERKIPEGSVLYTIKSQQVPLENFDKAITPVTKQGAVNFGLFSKWNYRLGIVLDVLLVSTDVLIILYFISLVWG